MDFFYKRWRYFMRRLSVHFQIYEADPSVAASFRAEQVRAILRITRFTMLANAANIVILLILFYGTPQFYQVLIWSTLLSYCIFLGTRSWLIQRSRPSPDRVSINAVDRAVRHAAILGTIWAVLPILIFDTNNPHHSLLVVSVCTGMLCAGGFALATIPQAAFTNVILVTIGCEIALIKDNLWNNLDLAILLIIYAFIVCAAVLASARTFGDA